MENTKTKTQKLRISKIQHIVCPFWIKINDPWWSITDYKKSTSIFDLIKSYQKSWTIHGVIQIEFSTKCANCGKYPYSSELRTGWSGYLTLMFLISCDSITVVFIFLSNYIKHYRLYLINIFQRMVTWQLNLVLLLNFSTKNQNLCCLPCVFKLDKKLGQINLDAM